MSVLTPLAERVWRVLEEDWDPIGVHDQLPKGSTEYGAYVGPVVRLILRGASIDEIAGHLTRITVEEMGLSPVLSHDQSVAAILFQLGKETGA